VSHLGYRGDEPPYVVDLGPKLAVKRLKLEAALTQSHCNRFRAPIGNWPSKFRPLDLPAVFKVEARVVTTVNRPTGVDSESNPRPLNLCGTNSGEMDDVFVSVHVDERLCLLSGPQLAFGLHWSVENDVTANRKATRMFKLVRRNHVGPHSARMSGHASLW
jgi:hypothetical protein